MLLFWNASNSYGYLLHSIHTTDRDVTNKSSPQIKKKIIFFPLFNVNLCATLYSIVWGLLWNPQYTVLGQRAFISFLHLTKRVVVSVTNRRTMDFCALGDSCRKWFKSINKEWIRMSWRWNSIDSLLTQSVVVKNGRDFGKYVWLSFYLFPWRAQTTGPVLDCTPKTPR